MSDSNKKVKVHKNPDRNQPTNYKSYVPQYQVHGVEPRHYQNTTLPSGTKVVTASALPIDNPRAKRPVVRQPYAEEVTSPIGRGRGPVPNVGNNMEHTWPSVDGEIIDDLTGEIIDSNQPMIDNNEFVTEQAMPFQSGFTSNDLQEPPMQGTVTIDETPVFWPEEPEVHSSPSNSENLFTIINDLSDEDLLLIVSGVPMCSGPREEIESQARAFLFGEHEMCDGNPVSIEEIVVLKKVKIKVGLFLE